MAKTKEKTKDSEKKNKEKKEKNSTAWTKVDEATLVQTLIKQKLHGNWGDNNPRPVAFTKCEKALAGSEARSGGTAKNVIAIKNH
jgi:hypothetical protein